MKRILITGGAGFIGSALALKLVALGYSVRVLDILSPQIHGKNPEESPLLALILGKVDFRRGSVLDREVMLSALQDIDTVVNLAAETGTGQSMYNIKHYTEVNVGGTALLFDILANTKTQVRKVVTASSRAVYGEGKYRCSLHGEVFPEMRSVAEMEAGDFELHCPDCHGVCSVLPTDEKAPVRPASIYGITKLNQEQITLVAGSALGISSIALRYQNVYGPGQSLSNPYTGILSIFSTRIRNGNPINIFEDGKESRDFVYIDDVVAATIRAIEAAGIQSGVFNVGSGQPTDVVTVASELASALGLKVPFNITGQFRVGDIRHNYADLKKAEQELGFKPQVSFGEGIRKFAQWVMAEAVESDDYDRSMSELDGKGLVKKANPSPANSTEPKPNL